MKNFTIIILVCATAVLGALYVRQGGQLSRNEARIVELEKALQSKDAVASKAVSAEKKVKELKTRLSETAGKAAEKSSLVNQLQEQLATAQTNASPMKGFAEMFKSPEMKEMMEKQQKAFIGPMIEKNYGGFFGHLNLSDEQKGYFKDLLEKKMLAATKSGMDMFGGDVDKAGLQEIGKKVKEETDAYDNQIKDFLGKENYQQFQEYEKTMPERMQLGQFIDQLPEKAQLNPDQEQQLMQLMADEREHAPTDWAKRFNGASDPAGNFTEMLSDENIAKFTQEKEQLDKRVLARAQKVLSTEQYTSFEQFLSAQRDMQVMGMKMASKMFGPKGK